MSKTLKGLNRDTTDKFYTKNEVVNICISYIKQHINFIKDDLIIEPSAGGGAFINSIKTLTDNYLFYDIKPEHDEIIQMDFLNIDIKNIKCKNHIHIIGNPPFGRQSSFAIRFIKKCCNFAKTISFILPKSFKKTSMRKHFNLNYHLVVEIDLSSYSFLLKDKDINVPCVFQIWEYRDNKRQLEELLKPNNFIFVKQEDNPDISFRRVGFNAGTISKIINDKNIQSHYFIKFTNNVSIDDNLLQLQKLKFDCDNTVGPKSISKQEIIKEFNKVI
jgi:hypothetical protein